MSWLGGKGIDTFYERQVLSYRPSTIRETSVLEIRIPDDVLNRMRRAQDFSLSSILKEYESEISRADLILEQIKQSNEGKDQFESMASLLEAGTYQEALKSEESLCGHEGTMDAELYALLFKTRTSLAAAAESIRSGYGEAAAHEPESMDLWVKSESDFLFYTERLAASSHSHDEMHDESQEEDESIHLLEMAYSAETAKEQLDRYHTSNADIGFVQKNRLAMSRQIIGRIERLASKKEPVMPGNPSKLKEKAQEKEDVTDLIAYLITAFQDKREEAYHLKMQYAMLDSQKESVLLVGQNRQYELMNRHRHSAISWLYEQEEEQDDAFHRFAEIMVDSVEKSGDRFQSMNAETLSFYRQQKIWQEELLDLIKRKEELREMLRIFMDVKKRNNI